MLQAGADATPLNLMRVIVLGRLAARHLLLRAAVHTAPKLWLLPNAYLVRCGGRRADSGADSFSAD